MSSETQPPISADEFVLMGQVSQAFGIKGWIKLQVFTEFAESLGDFTHWWLEVPAAPGRVAGWEQVAVEVFEVKPNGILVKLVSCNDRSAAEALRQRNIAVKRSELPVPAPGVSYWIDLVGATVINAEGETLGVLDSMLATPAHEVLVVKYPAGERLIPAVPEIVLEVNVAERRVVVVWGLDY